MSRRRNHHDDQVSPQVTRLLDALLGRDIAPTQQEISKVVELAYAIGKNDGAIEQCDRLLKGRAAA